MNDSKLALDVDVCLPGLMRWSSVPHLQCSWDKFRDPEQDEVVSRDE